MSKVFIFSNSIGTYSLLYVVERLCGTGIDTVITTDESIFANMIKSFNFEIKYYNSVETCVSHSDIILVYNDGNLPEHVINKIKSISTKQNKKCIMIDDCKSIELGDSLKHDFIDSNNLDTPAIVIFSLGLATIPIKVEFDINHIFADAGVSINHYLSPYSKFIAEQFRNAGLNGNRLELFNDSRLPDVYVYFFDLNDNILNISKHYNLLTSIKPDYIIVLTDYDISNYDDLLMYVRCFCMRYPDIVVKSRWFSIGNNMFCHSDCFENTQQEKNKFVLDFEDKDFLSKLKFDMFSKITLAEGMKRI